MIRETSGREQDRRTRLSETGNAAPPTGPGRSVLLAGTQATAEWRNRGRPPTTLVFCTSFVRDTGSKLNEWSSRYRTWVDAVRASLLRFDQLLIVDDGSGVLPDWPDAHVVQEGDDTTFSTKPVVIYHFKKNLGRPDVSDFPGWVRSYFFAAKYARQHGFEKVIHIESDAFIVSARMQKWANDLTNGWTALHDPRWHRPESAIQVIAGDQLAAYHAYASQDVDVLKNEIVETCLPFTAIEDRFTGERYNETQAEIPPDADWCSQAAPRPGFDAKQFYWWLPEVVAREAQDVQRAMVSHGDNLWFDLSLSGLDHGMFVSGWAERERNGTWMLGKQSTLRLPLPERREAPAKLVIMLAAVPFTSKALHQSQRLRITAANQEIADLEVTEAQHIRFELPVALAAGRDYVFLNIEHPDAMSPHDAGLSEDVRPLSFLMHGVGVTAEA